MKYALRQLARPLGVKSPRERASLQSSGENAKTGPPWKEKKKKNSPAAALSLLSSLSSFFAPSFSPSFQKNFQAAMINDEGQVVDLYIPRKW